MAALLAGCSTDAGDDGSDDNDDAVSMEGFTGHEYDVEHLPVALATGDVVRHGAASILIPDPGEGVTAEGLRGDGVGDELSVEVADDGTVTVTTDPVEPPSPAEDAAARIPGPCHDRRSNIFGYSWHSTLEYRFNASTTPVHSVYGIPVNFAEEAIRKGGENIVNEHNNCGRADHISAKIRYLGRTSRGTNVTRAGTCARRDGHSVVAFGNFNADQPWLAVTCTYWVKRHVPRTEAVFHVAVESDVRISRTDYQWWGPNQDCIIGGAPGWLTDLEAVMTHERGHSFGLAHVSHASYLTMAPTVGYCDRSDRTLGLGDMLGLEMLY